MAPRHAAREISYAHSAETRRARAVIRLMENSTGRLRLLRHAKGYDQEVAEGADFWRVMCDRYKLGLDVVGGDLSHIPETGPLVVVANHPYGILDGLMMGRILSERRGGDFKVLANSVFRKSSDLEKVILPVSFDDTKDAAVLNLKTRRDALCYLNGGGAIGVFPGGTVSTAARPFSKALDPQWRNFTAKMIAKSDATVVPIFFDGTNSRVFQLASRMSQTLRMGLLIREFRARVGSDVRTVIGAPIPPSELKARAGDAKSLMDFLRKATYDLSPTPLPANDLGLEFETRYKRKG
ncbi:lysophospholipid acyltransferase family protein [Pseudooctadecabacter jejudonensis]|uniref:Phospholipid/glycerol acyltransferase domain-containing protein n=1 Tax=Pseudooctadecabacter jejudonensis TaxID=1391910 RepID=A0A1Y5R9R9_9RHOB|nr:lysophospholipid acyltransferase family protein [Pseudooctadecabacter jejudonensis]SLN12446.1 hypothetical protein PSJ8397_00172 [Pseudooctadecabacter jejudonensis]